MLSLCFRSLAAAKGQPTVSSTAAATIRQAVAICFDHAVLPTVEGLVGSPRSVAAAPLVTLGASRSSANSGGMQAAASAASKLFGVVSAAAFAGLPASGPSTPSAKAPGGDAQATGAAVLASIAAVPSGRQRAALHLLNDLCVMCEGAWRACGLQRTDTRFEAPGSNCRHTSAPC